MFPEQPSGQQTDLAELLRRLEEQHGWGQIIGPHGSGKSTLLADLMRQLRQQDRPIVYFAIDGGQRRLPAEAANWRHWQAGTQVIVDGYEQLSRWSRFRLRRRCRWHRAGLLVTAHRDMGLPLLYQTEATLATAQAVVARLLTETDSPITPQDVSHCHRRSKGNLRETLFALYDLYQQRQA